MTETNNYTFPVPADYCLVLKAFNESSSLREAAILLNMDPGALARKVQKISQEFGLFYKIGNRWVATETGKKLSQWVDDSILIQKSVLNQKPTIRLSSCTWFAEQALVPNFSSLKELTKDQCSWTYLPTSENHEEELLNSKVDFIISSQAPYDPEIAHKKIMAEDWVVIVPLSWQNDIKDLKNDELVDFLKSKPLVKTNSLSAETSIGFTAEVVSEFTVNDLIGLRSAVKAGLGWGCLPKIAVRSHVGHGSVLEVDLPVVSQKWICLWWPRARKDLNGFADQLSNWIKESIS